jgi:hypothetical protein
LFFCCGGNNSGKMVKMGRGREEDRGEPGAVAPEQNRALGRYVSIWTTNLED